MTTMTSSPADDSSTSNVLPPSPHAMAQAALDEAIAERDRQAERSSSSQTTDGTAPDDAAVSASTSKRPRVSHNVTDGISVKDQLKQVWEGKDKDEALESTRQLISREIESLIRSGLEAFHREESLNRELLQVKEESGAKERELRRLRASEEQSRATITNLLRTVETAKASARDASRVVQVEARLRADLAKLREERNDALAEAAESKRKAHLLDEDVRITKSKLSKVLQEKIKMERDSRAAISLARSLDSHASSDCDFYRRKVSELTNTVQTQQVLVAEQKHQIDEMKRQFERSLSQNRLANIRAESDQRRYFIFTGVILIVYLSLLLLPFVPKSR